MLYLHPFDVIIDRENVQFYGSFIETPCIWKSEWESDGKNSDNEKLGSCQRHPSSFCREIKKGALRLDQLNKFPRRGNNKTKHSRKMEKYSLDNKYFDSIYVSFVHRYSHLLD